MNEPNPILDPLNEDQRAAVLHTQGPTFILAGAGSGKTRALTHRIAYLISQGVQPWQILSVTFTNKAAKEMKERIGNLLHIVEGTEHVPFASQTGKLPVMGTFHSVCVRILRREIEKLGRDRTFVIYDADDQDKLMKQVLKELAIDEKELKPRAALSYIGRFKSEATSPKEAEAQATTPRMHQLIRVYTRYQGALRKANALDFDDLILETVRLFHELPEVLDRYQETWRYLHVDEYQDTNHSQYLLLTLLAQKYRNLCVIGDPDQSIYAFRGADIRNILEFQKEYPDAVRITLDRNYRSTQPILTAADAVIALNPQRPEKHMWTDRSEGPKIIVQEVGDERREAEEMIKRAEELKREGLPLNHQAVLYRTNAQSRLFEEACLRHGVPYRIIGGVKFYARKEVKDVLAYLYAILNPYDTLSILRVINVPSRKIGQTTIGRLQEYCSAQGVKLWDALKEIDRIDDVNEPTKQRIMAFTELLERYRDRMDRAVVSALAKDLIEETGMEKWLRDDTEEGETRWGNVQELLTVMHKYDRLEPRESLTSFLEEAMLISEVDKLADINDDALTLMTLHLCKGLEFESVYVVGCEEGVFPVSGSLYDREQLEEERRLMYVGMTRAKTHLRLMLARSRMLWGQSQANAPSRFLSDLPEAVTERRSDELLSAFAWASQSGFARAAGAAKKLEPFRQGGGDLDLEFNQDFALDDASQTQEELGSGSRVRHPSFGTGTIVDRRGDVATIKFDTGQQKSFALSIAPLTSI